VSAIAAAERTGVTSTTSTQSPSDIDTDSPTSLLTSLHVSVAPLAAHSSANSGTNLGSPQPVYSAAKLRYLAQAAVRQYLEVVLHYLALRSTTTAAMASRTASGIAAAPQWSAYVLLAATAAEGLANVAFSLGAAFQEHFRQVPYYRSTVSAVARFLSTTLSAAVPISVA
jgi:hypothetical protein